MLHFITALSCEARPLVERFGMKARGNRGRIQFFEGEKARLAISGVGCLRSAIATTSLGERFSEPEAIWLNVGLCGHRDAPIGQAYLANRITRVDSRDAFYPQCPWSSPWPGIEVLSQNQPSTAYTEKAFDMEAYGFYAAAIAFASSEWIHCLKVVSDNVQQPAHQPLDPQKVSELIKAQIPSIDAFTASIQNARPGHRPSDWPKRFSIEACNAFPFSETEKLQLRARLRKLDCLLNEGEKRQLSEVLGEIHPQVFLEQLQSLIDHHSTLRVC